jgi:hypothetical protein
LSLALFFKSCGDTIRRAVIRTPRSTTLPKMASEADFLLAFGMAALARTPVLREASPVGHFPPLWDVHRRDPQRPLHVDSCRPRHSPKLRERGNFDPELPFEIGPLNGWEVRENGLRDRPESARASRGDQSNLVHRLWRLLSSCNVHRRERNVQSTSIRDVASRAVSRQISIGYFRRRISPSALTIREQKQWDPTEARSARSQYRI